MPEQKKLFLLDAMALIYRAYFAFANNHRINSKGQNTSAVFGFTTTVLEVLKKENPTHIAVAFDTAAPTSRHEEFADYKAHRDEIPEDLASNIPLVVKLCEAFNIPVIAMDGYEADDVIGTLAKNAEKKGFDTYMMTSDKDFGQLVDEHTFIYKPARAGDSAQVLGVKEVCARWEIENVDQVRDILGLMGDASDNIPGIRGVGEKTAIKLIKEFGTIEKLLKNTDKLKGSLKEKVENDKDMAVQSKRPATIQIDVPVKIKLEKLEWKDLNRDAGRELFTELEFRRLADQVLGDKPKPVSSLLSFKSFEAYYVPAPPVYDAAKAIVNEFKKVFEDESVSKSGQNLKYDMEILSRYGVEVKGKLFDTMIAHFLVHPDMSHGMDAMSEAFLKYSPVSIETLIGKKQKGKDQGTIGDVPLEKISD